MLSKDLHFHFLNLLDFFSKDDVGDYDDIDDSDDAASNKYYSVVKDLPYCKTNFLI